MLRSFAPVVAAAALVAGCGALTSPMTKLSDNAHDMNTAMQFGRMDIAGDYVAASARPAFVVSHAAWGKSVRIVDSEVTGFRLKDRDDAEVFVTVSWQTLSDPNMHETRVVQHWKSSKGSWAVDSETPEGDVGLLGEKPKARPAPAGPAPGAEPPSASAPEGPPPSLPTVELAPKRGRYQTRVIYDD